MSNRLTPKERKELADSFPKAGYVRARQISAFMNIGVSSFWLKVKNGEIEKGFKLGKRTTVWRAEYIRGLCGEVA